MRILITNDDGINAPGLAVMERIAAQLGDEVWTVAPETDQSGIGHALTLSDPLRIRDVGARRFAVTGTPADCAIVGVRTVMPEPPDLVLSGVNAGANIADDVVYSGTVGGAMEARLMGIPAIAVSQHYWWDETKVVPWQTAEAHGPGVLRRLIGLDLPNATFLNVNFPPVEPDEVRGVAVGRQGSVEHGLVPERREDMRGNDYHWLRFSRGEPRIEEGTDVSLVRGGFVSVTPLQIDLTAHASIKAVEAALAT